jgi:hypothetical protein
LFCEKRLLWDLNSKEVREFHNGLDGLELGERKRGRGSGEEEEGKRKRGRGRGEEEEGKSGRSVE